MGLQTQGVSVNVSILPCFTGRIVKWQGFQQGAKRIKKITITAKAKQKSLVCVTLANFFICLEPEITLVKFFIVLLDCAKYHNLHVFLIVF